MQGAAARKCSRAHTFCRCSLVRHCLLCSSTLVSLLYSEDDGPLQRSLTFNEFVEAMGFFAVTIYDMEHAFPTALSKVQRLFLEIDQSGSTFDLTGTVAPAPESRGHWI